MANPKTLDDTVCLGCACLCDDVRLTVVNGAVTEAANACLAGHAWFTQPTAPADEACWVAGERATLDTAVAAAAELLAATSRPHVVGLAGVSVDAQRHAVAIADLLGGVTAAGSAASARALVTHGSVGATLGEVAQRADVVVFWRCDPAATHPRHFERYSLRPASEFLPGGRADRRVFAIGDAGTETAAEADDVIALSPETKIDDALAVVRSLTRGLPIDDNAVHTATGARLDDWRSLVDATREAKYVAVFYDGGLGAADPSAIGAMTDWMKDLQATTRCAALPLGGGTHHANAAGAASVLAWQSGYAGVVDFGRGYPRPLDRMPEDADATLTVSAETTPIATGKRVVLATTDDGADRSADVWFRVAPPGFARKSSAYRSDGVALPLREPWAADALAAESVLVAIEQALVKHLATAAV